MGRSMWSQNLYINHKSVSTAGVHGFLVLSHADRKRMGFKTLDAVIVVAHKVVA